MARTYREIAIEDIVLTVEEAMSRVLDWWGDLPPSMKEAIEQFRTELGAAIDSVEFVKKALGVRHFRPSWNGCRAHRISPGRRWSNLVVRKLSAQLAYNYRDKAL